MPCQKNEYRLCIYLLSTSLTAVFTGIYILLHIQKPKPMPPMPMPVVQATKVLEVEAPKPLYRNLLL